MGRGVAREAWPEDDPLVRAFLGGPEIDVLELGVGNVRFLLRGLARPLLGPLLGRFLQLFADFSDFLGRLHPRQTRLQKPLNTLGVEEST